MSGTTTRRGPGGRRSRIAIVFAYALFSILWITLSDRILGAFVTDAGMASVAQTAKGIAFVLLTATLIWALLLARDIRLDRERADLAESEERYRMLAERSQDIVFRLRMGAQPHFDYLSPAIMALTGHTPAEHYADARLSQDRIHPDDRAALYDAAARGLEGPIVVRWFGEDGSTTYLEHRVTGVLDADGTLVAIEGSARDVTARVRADEERLRLGHAIDRSPIGILLAGGAATDFAVTYVNPALCEMTGRSAESLIGRSALGFNGVDGPVLSDELAAKLAAGEPFEVTALLPRDGAPIPGRIIVSPLRGRDGENDGILAFLQDGTEAAARTRAESLLHAALTASPLAAVTTDLDGTVVAWNPAAERLFGWTADQVVGSVLPFVDDDARAVHVERRRALVEETGQLSLIRPFRRADGTRLMGHVTTGVIHDADGTPTGLISLVGDLTDSLRRDELNAQLRRAIEYLAEAVVITDVSGTISYVNPAFEAVSGYAADELIGRNPRVLKSGLTPSSVYEDMWHKLTAGETWRGVIVNRRKDGSTYEEEATLSAVLGPDGRPSAYVGVKRDLTLERRLADGMRTELMDRAAVEEAMARIEVGETADATAQAVCDALASFGDVDDVALIYLPPGRSLAVPIACVATTMPIHLGEPVEPAFAAYLRERAVGGPWADNHAAGRVDPRIDRAPFEGVIRVAAPIRLRGRTVGVLLASTRSSTPDAWVARHMRITSELATHAGPILGPQLETHDLGSASADEVRRIIAEGAFSPVFQPVCDLATRQPIGWEAFTRFADGTAPLQRFADARALGLGEALEIAAGQRAMEAFASLGCQGWLSINVSPALVLSGQGSRIVSPAGRQVVLELTEQVEIDDYARLRGAVDLLDPPAMLALDDAGAGYASLRHVLELRPDFVKLEPAFVHDIDRDETRQAMVAGMVHYAAENDTRLIAEGIETEAERRTLLRLGVSFGQGYLLGVPSSSGAVAAQRTSATPRRLRALDDAGIAQGDSAAG